MDIIGGVNIDSRKQQRSDTKGPIALDLKNVEDIPVIRTKYLRGYARRQNSNK